MKIIHLNTHAYGGAAVVARRLHQASLAHGLNSRLVTKFGLRGDTTPHYAALRNARIQYALRRSSENRYVYKLGKYVQGRFQHKNLQNRPAGLEIFSPLTAVQTYAGCVDDFDPDVIHLHWVAGFVDHPGFFERNRDKRFVWTLHDMNPFTGGCHHADGCGRFVGDCTQCPQLVGTIDRDYAARILHAKQTVLSVLRDEQIVFVSPSRWMLDLAQRSKAIGRFQHRLIENPTFVVPEASTSSGAVPREFDIRKKNVLFLSDNLRNPRKGIGMLFDAARELIRGSDVHFVGVGQRIDTPRDLSVSFAGSITSEAELARYYRAADVVVLPSAAENAPLTVIEALSCGTPVVGFRVGGVPELVDTDCGVLVDERTPARLAAGLDVALFQRSFSRDQIRGKAARFSTAAVLQKYHSIYTELTKS